MFLGGHTCGGIRFTPLCRLNQWGRGLGQSDELSVGMSQCLRDSRWSRAEGQSWELRGGVWVPLSACGA